MGREDVWGRDSVEVRGGNSTMGSGDRVKANVDDVSMMCWNAVGWSKGDVFRSVKAVDKNDFRAKVIDSYNPIIVWWRLRDDEEVEFDGFRWFGQNRIQLNKKAVRG